MDQEKQSFKHNIYLSLGITPEDGTLSEEELLEHIGINQETYRAIIAAITEELETYANNSDLGPSQEEKNYLDLITSLINIDKKKIFQEKEKVESEAKKNNLSILEQLLKEYQFTDIVLNYNDKFTNQISKMNMIVNHIIGHLSLLIKTTIEFNYHTNYCEEILRLLAKKVIYNLSLYGVDPRAIALSHAHHYLPSPMLDEVTNQITQEEWEEILEDPSIDNFIKINVYLITKQNPEEVTKYLQETTNTLEEEHNFLKEIYIIFNTAITWNNGYITQYIIDRFFKITNSAGKILFEVFIRGNYKICLKFIQAEAWNLYTASLKVEIIKTIILRSGEITSAKLLKDLKYNKLLTPELLRDVIGTVPSEEELQLTKIQKALLPIMAEDAASLWDSYEDKIGLLKLIIAPHQDNQESIILKHLHNEALLNYGHYKAVQQELRNMGLKSKAKKLFSKYIKLLKAENNKALYGELYIPGENEENYATGYTEEEFITSFKASSKKEQSGFLKRFAKKIQRIIQNTKLNFEEKSKVIEIKMKKIEHLLSHRIEPTSIKDGANEVILKEMPEELLSDSALSIISDLKEAIAIFSLGISNKGPAVTPQTKTKPKKQPSPKKNKEDKPKDESKKGKVVSVEVNPNGGIEIATSSGNKHLIIEPDEAILREEAIRQERFISQQFLIEKEIEEQRLLKTTEDTSINNDPLNEKPKAKKKKNKSSSKNKKGTREKVQEDTHLTQKELPLATDSVTTTAIEEEAEKTHNEVALQPKPSPKKKAPYQEKEEMKKVKKLLWTLPGKNSEQETPAETVDKKETTTKAEKSPVIINNSKEQKTSTAMVDPKKTEISVTKPVAKKEVKPKAKQASANSKGEKTTALKKFLNIPEKAANEQKPSTEKVELKEDKPHEHQPSEQVDAQNLEPAVTKIETKEEDNSKRLVEKQELTLPPQNHEEQHTSIVNQQKFIYQQCNTYYVNSQGEQIEAFTLPNAHLAINQYGEYIPIANLQLYQLDPSQAMTLQIQCNNFCYNQNKDKVEVFTLPGSSCGIDQYGNQFSINSNSYNPVPPALQVVVVERIVYVPLQVVPLNPPTIAQALNHSAYPPYSTGYNMQGGNGGNNYPGGGGSGKKLLHPKKKNHNIKNTDSDQETTSIKPIIIITPSLENKIILSAEVQESRESIQIINEQWNNQEKLLVEIDNHHQFEITKPYNASYVPVDIEDNLMPRLPLFFEENVKFAGAEEEGMNLMPII